MQAPYFLSDYIFNTPVLGAVLCYAAAATVRLWRSTEWGFLEM